MRSAAMLAASMLTLALGGCNASGAKEKDEAAPSARRDFTVGAFHSVSLTGSPDVVVTVGGRPSVRAEGDARMVERLDVRIVEGDLKIGFLEGSSFRSMFGHDRNVTIHVTVPSLAAANLTGSGDIRIDRVQGPNFAGLLSGSGDLEVGQMRVDAATFSLNGSGGIRAAGAARSSQLHLAGSGDIELSRLETSNATVALMGSGDIRARATESARVALMGSGDVTIAGPARCEIDKRGPGEVRCNAGG
jgi:hypothetical protein